MPLIVVYRVLDTQKCFNTLKKISEALSFELNRRRLAIVYGSSVFYSLNYKTFWARYHLMKLF